MSIDPAEFERIKEVALLMRNYFRNQNLLIDDINLIANTVLRFRLNTLNQFITNLQGFRDFVQANGINRGEIVKAMELLKLIRG